MLKLNPFIIGIAGGSGSGKTTIAKAIASNLDISDVFIIQHDSYYKDRSYLSMTEREKLNYDHPNSLETNLLITHLKKFSSGKSVKIPIYDFNTHTRRKERLLVPPSKVIIIDGILIFVECKLRELIDLKVFIDTDPDIRFIRRLQRDVSDRKRSMKTVIQQYMESVRAMHMKFVEPSFKYADIIIPGFSNQTEIKNLLNIIKNRIERLNKSAK